MPVLILVPERSGLGVIGLRHSISEAREGISSLNSVEVVRESVDEEEEPDFLLYAYLCISWEAMGMLS